MPNSQDDTRDQLQSEPTDYAALVIQVLTRCTRSTGGVDQHVLRQCLGLSSSYLLTDSTTNSSSGLMKWNTGFNRLVDVLVALHGRGELELSTVSEASKACSECWTIAGSWGELDDVRKCVKAVAGKLRSLLDENGKTYRGQRVYVP